jgi:hypothetical protein
MTEGCFHLALAATSLLFGLAFLLRLARAKKK